MAERRGEYDEELPAEFDEELDQDVEEMLSAWDAAEATSAALLRNALADHRGAAAPPLGEACTRLREDIRAGRDPAAWMHEGSGMGGDLPADDADLLLTCLAAVIAGPEDRGLEVEEESLLDTLEQADWLGAVVSLVRGGAGTAADPRAIIRGIESTSDVNVPAGIDASERSHLEAAFAIVTTAWLEAGCVDGDERLTAVGEWALPRGLARAWGSDFDAA